jgi:cytochrome c oxidase subunit I+III
VTAVAAPPVARPEGAVGETFEETWADPRGFLGQFRSINNIPIARRYMVTAFAFFLVGGAEAALLRIQLGTPENTFLDPETYNQIFTMHGTTMMFLFVIPFVEAIANYMLALQVGARDLPFPRLTALSYWTYLWGGLFLYASFLFGAAPDGGWFSYLPLNNRQFSPGVNMDFWDIGLSVAEIAALGASAEMIVGVLRARAPGMSLDRIPYFAWAMLVTAVMILFAFTPLIVGTAMLELDRKGLTGFFETSAGGDPLLWQHIFWVFGHPEVYIMFVPAVGLVSHMVQTFTRRPLVSYTALVLATVATGVISFGLWVHHMFTTGVNHAAMSLFTAASLLIVIPNGVQVFTWIASLWAGRPVWRTPMRFVMGFLVIFILGGMTGVMTAVVPFDAQVHDSYFVVAHFHYVLIGGVIFPLIGALYYWLPKVTGRMLSERVGKWNFWTMFVFFNVAFFPMHIAGMLGMPRRVYTYPAGMGLEIPNLISTIGAVGFALGVLLFVGNALWSFRRGPRAGPNPWGGDSLEWSEDSPPADAQFARLPVVRSRNPMWDQDDFGPRSEEEAEKLRPLDHGPAHWRGTLVVRPVTGEPLAIVHMPASTYWPFVLSLGMLALFVAALIEDQVLFWVGVGISAVALTGWFWPQPSEALAIRELGTDAGPTKLPLAVAGPLANGWWGTLIGVGAFATALVTLVASHYYLLPDSPVSPVGPGLQEALALGAAVGAVLLGGVARWIVRASRRRDHGARRTALIVGLALLAAITWLTVAGYRAGRDLPAASAHASTVIALLGFGWLVTAVAFVVLFVALLWALRAPRDERGHAPAENGVLLATFGAVAWLVVLAVLALDPVLRGQGVA